MIRLHFNDIRFLHLDKALFLAMAVQRKKSVICLLTVQRKMLAKLLLLLISI